MTFSALVVDDEPTVTDLVSAILERDGYRCRAAGDGAQALAMLAEQPADFVLTDVRMPGMNGLELLEQVRMHYPDIFVILLTGAADVEMVVRALRSGACDFITKPFRLEGLQERMRLAEQRRADAMREREADAQRRNRLDHLARRYAGLASGVLEALSAVLETKHPETRAHSQRVALHAADLATRLGRPSEEVKALYVAGLLHDIGKVAVDNTVLDKPERLDVTEFDQIRAHPEESARIVAPIASAATTMRAIRHHHERLDGRGYPDGLRGLAIPLGARILSVCDAYDAMTSARAYHPAVPLDEALERLRAGAGSQWDPEVVEAFCALESEAVAA
ncbi:MAG: response regulator [Chthonomonadales bacterium]|nr:response regulator [Chthonomonadales bacterium]